ncbi:MAG TPA: hypothetical protein PKL77_10435 [Candidatus Omnitrophota bacterium]|nr:hypothetical protein [Candidatus Omnitrophota bacterium]HPT08004.1 hypothetical protein [Candidatus Omnitrophota bacterium]
MVSDKQKHIGLGQVFASTIQSFRNHPQLFLPFVVFFILEIVVLLFVFIIPRDPIVKLFGPPIRTLWGEGFLHYPFNFILLPKLASLSRLVLTVFAGSFTTGWAVFLVWALYQKKTLRISESASEAFKRYMSLFFVVLTVTLVLYFFGKLIGIGLLKYFGAGHAKLLFIPARVWLGPIEACIGFILSIVVQAIFIYAVPILLLNNDKPIRSLARSVGMFRRLPVVTTLLVFFPILLYVPIIVLLSNTQFLIGRVFPEFVLLVLCAGSVITSLVIDPFITVASAFIVIKDKEARHS